ncbi:thioesterase II family protein [Krasilnikovia sp. MM14-A1004]|uniref:thioesterase II family protein n=1 Tax=Krasilnikovia sp. MM14-A1004 TaxID=3373541 RepID=UPI00399CCEB9
MTTLAGPGLTRGVVVPRPRPGAERRLVVFPHAGGAASFYRAWHRMLPADVELQIVQYPGRETRFTEPLPASLTAMAGEAAAALRHAAHQRPRTVLFGHSMGAAVAYEAALALEQQGETGCAELFVSCRCAPGLRPAGRTPQTEEEILRSVRRFGGTPAVLLDDPQYRAILVSLLRHDYRLNGSYRRMAPAPVRMPVTAVWSRDDPTVTADMVEPWREYTTGRFRREIVEGGHFYLVPHLARVVELVLSGTAAGAQDETYSVG